MFHGGRSKPLHHSSRPFHRPYSHHQPIIDHTASHACAAANDAMELLSCSAKKKAFFSLSPKTNDPLPREKNEQTTAPGLADK